MCILTLKVEHLIKFQKHNVQPYLVLTVTKRIWCELIKVSVVPLLMVCIKDSCKNAQHNLSAKVPKDYNLLSTDYWCSLLVQTFRYLFPCVQKHAYRHHHNNNNNCIMISFQSISIDDLVTVFSEKTFQSSLRNPPIISWVILYSVCRFSTQLCSWMLLWRVTTFNNHKPR